MSSNNGATFCNNLTPIANTRILSDRSLVEHDKQGYIESNIYFDFNDTSILDNEFRILTIGSTDLSNPYFGGFFMFYGKFPDQYPFYPPHILAKTQGAGTRFHPNYYVNGKCCLSILGTWAGPPWTSCQNLGTTAQALKSLFIENPITQEPGWGECTDGRAETYSRVIEYRTLQIAVLKMLSDPPLGFESFIPIMEETFIKLYPMYMEKLDLLMKNHKKCEQSIYNCQNDSMKVTYDIIALKEAFIQKYESLGGVTIKPLSVNNILDSPLTIVSLPEQPVNTILDSPLTSVSPLQQPSNSKISSKKNGRKCPNEKSSTFPVGFIKQSTNAEKDWWIVYETSSGQKRWKKTTIPPE